VYADETRSQVLFTYSPLRQQGQKRDGIANKSLADFIAPQGQGQDYIGLFAVTAGLGAEKKEAQFDAQHDDYSSIMFKALADRLAEAFAECLHHRVRTDLWGYAPGEALSNEDMIAEKYQGIRPAPLSKPCLPPCSARPLACSLPKAWPCTLHPV
jgi:5-methyltetrahydrofolate--homocysteine methyltransferase